MATYQNSLDFEQQSQNKNRIAKEKAIGIKAAKALERSMIRLIGAETIKHTGELLNSKVVPFVDENIGLRRIYINNPHYGYKLNYGFIGIKEGGVKMRLIETAHISDSIEKTSIVELLATEISQLRADQIVAQIKF